MIPEKLLQVLKYEGVVAIATSGPDGPHLVNTWISYVQVVDGRLVFPAGGMHKTEANVAKNDNVLVTLGSRGVDGFRGPGAGFLVRGTASFIKTGLVFDLIQRKFPWARAAVEISVASITQTL